MGFDTTGDIIWRFLNFASFIFCAFVIMYVLGRIFAKNKKGKVMEMENTFKGTMLKYHLCKAMKLIQEGKGKAWFECDSDIVLAMATIAGSFLHSKPSFTDPETEKKIWRQRKDLIEALSICPCCLRTFHQVVIHDQKPSVSFPPGVYEKITRYLNSNHPQKALAISLLMIALDIKIDRAKEIVKNWHKIEK